MASRFGAPSASRSKNARLKILVACIFLLLLLFLAILAYVIQNQQNADGLTTGPAVDNAANQANIDSIPVLVAGFRIEEGSALSEQMFIVDQVKREEVPPNAVTADRQKMLTGKFAKRLINPNVILLNDDISDVQPLTQIDIPAGFRLITIIVDNRTGVEGWAKPSTRVDVLYTFTQDGNRKVATIARFVKVISVAGNAQNNPEEQGQAVAAAGPVTVSLLVSEEQAKYIELARATGELSLVLVGGQELPGSMEEDPNIVDINKILKRPQEQEAEAVPDGVLYVEDQVTRKQKKYVLIKGRWTLDKTYDQ